MSVRPRSAHWAWVVWSLIVAAYVALLLLNPSASREGGPNAWLIVVAVGVFILSYATTGALIASRHPDNPVGWLALAAGLLYTTAGSILLYAEEGLAVDPRPGAELLYQLSGWMWVAAVSLGGPFLILLFPTGRLPSHRWRVVSFGLGLGLAAFIVSSTFRPGPIEPGVPWSNPIGIAAAAGFLRVLGAAGGVLLALSSLLALASVLVRFRTAPPQQRQQLKWFYLALATAFVIALPIGFLLELAKLYELSNLAITIGLSLIPVSIGVAIVRHRVFDIDVVVNKTLVYGSLTAILAGCYVGAIVVLPRVSPVGADSDLAVAASTLAVAALFQPLRSRVQGFIDRRFYRRKYDAADTLRDFSARLRDQVDLDALGRQLVFVVGATMQPAHASLWLRQREVGE